MLLQSIIAVAAVCIPATSSAVANSSSVDQLAEERQMDKPLIDTTFVEACKALQPADKVYYTATPQYLATLDRFISSTVQAPTCLFMPTQPQEIVNALKVIADKRVPFAVSSSRHASNKGFSSTTGIQIDMKGFQQVNLDPSNKAFVDVGPGNVWDNVYASLEGSGVNVVGGRVTGVGVGGFITGGGGYSWKTNQYGLTADTLIKADLVLPNGTLATVSATENAELFWAIKGGGNQFGIIYNFRLRTHPQTAQVYGGLRTYTADQIPAVVRAVADFSANNTDPKAQIIPTFNTIVGQPGVSLLGFYDGPDPGTSLNTFNGPAKTFTNDWRVRPFPDFVRSTPANATANLRGLFHTVSLKEYSLPIMQQIANQSQFWGTRPLRSGVFISYDVEPFNSDWARKTSTDAAWPHDNSPIPLNIYFAWVNPLDDDYYREAALESARLLNALADSEGQNVAQYALYPNYALYGSNAARVFGANAPRLARLKHQYDPEDIMGLTTYFTFN
ncbi:hypothetical protein HIM_08782 [Hirsutella minnesotensis 3608]|uniref:FAD-binding PCMH-type domain-containing protein n=1 Tax=Hirsutella minnesotensis 3608 TaxID=1043627 RepID=A0A0F8A3H8_9HYPO|nr:hypothetical protein HIM_08782 [Hirsutella minnesotensis 3608]